MMYSRVANRIQNSLLINDLIKSDKPVIFLVSEEQQIEKENLFGFAHLFMGEKITVDEENEYPIYKPFDKKGIKEHILSLSVCEKLVKSIQIIQTKQGILVTFNLNQWNQINDQNKKEEGVDNSLFEMFIEKTIVISKIVEKINTFNCPTKLYGVVQYDKKVSRENIRENLMNKLLKFLNIQNNCLLEFNAKKDLSSGRKDHMILRTPKNSEITSFPYNAENLFTDVRKSEVAFNLNFLQGSNKEECIKTLLINKSIELQGFVNDFVKIFLTAANLTQLEESICEGEDVCQNLLIRFKTMIQEFNDFMILSKATKLFEKRILEKIQPFYIEIKGKYCKNYAPKENKIEKSLCQYFYYHEFREMFNDISKNNSLNINDQYGKAKEFMNHMISLFNELHFDCENRKEMSKCGAYFEQVFQQMKYLIKYSGSTSTPLRTIIDYLKKNLKPNQQFSKVVLSIEFTKDQTIDFYESLLELFESIVISKDIGKDKEQEIHEKKNYKVMKIKEHETQKLIDLYLGRNDKQIALAILRLYDIYERGSHIEEKYKREFNFNQILLRCARLLRSIARSDLAIKIYKKLKHYLKVEDCVQQISLELQKDEKIEFYLKYSEYFRKVGDKNVAWKYLQKSSQEYQYPPEKVLRAKNEFYENPENEVQSEKRLIKQIMEKQIAIDEYLRGNELDQTFKTNLLNIINAANKNPEPIRVYFSNGLLTNSIEAVISNV